MTRSIIKWSAENRWIVLLATAALVLFAVYTLRTIPVDAIPDLSDTQVIVYSRWDRSPDIVEDQVTYPIVTALLGAPKVKTIRGFSDFGFCYVYVIFEDGTDIYWARSRVARVPLEDPAAACPRACAPSSAPTRPGVGWVFQYALVDDSGQHSLADLRTFQDWTLRYRLQSVPGRRRGRDLRRLPAAVPGDGRPEPAQGLRPRRSWRSPRRCAAPTSRSAAGSSRSRARSTWSAGAATSDTTADLEKIVLRADPLGTPVLLRDVGRGDPRPRDPARGRRPRRPRATRWAASS